KSGISQFPNPPSPMSVTIPASPFMQKLGFGTGVSVYLMKRLGIVILGNPGGDPGFPPRGHGAEGGIWELWSGEGMWSFGITLSQLEFWDLGSIPGNSGTGAPLF
uniref:Uncharacterized protein n=1 Tax=Junco hyemalis TaxID=40217 RepID=A0A8C5IXC1_JUNHY